MEKNFNIEQKLGDIVIKFPKAMEIFKKYRIDFCCGGNRSLQEAASEQGINGDKVLADLEEGYKENSSDAIKKSDWHNESYLKIIEYVVSTHHAYLYETLPRLSELTAKILRVHGDHHPELAEVHKLLHTLKVELEQHLIKEEEIVFPLIIEYESTGAVDVLKKAVEKIHELEGEHEGAGDILKQLREVTEDYKVPEDGCGSYRLTYKLLEDVEDDTFRHIHLENNIMFPRLETKLSTIG